MKKECNKCKKILPIEQFYKRDTSPDGYKNECKVCKSKRARQYRLDHPNLIKQQKALEYKNNKQACDARNKKWIKDNPLKRKNIIKKSNKKHHASVLARRNFNNSLRYKNFKRPPCQICNTPHAEAHHSDYSKPLEVVWLCRSHHAAWHRVFLTEQE